MSGALTRPSVGMVIHDQMYFGDRLLLLFRPVVLIQAMTGARPAPKRRDG